MDFAQELFDFHVNENLILNESTSTGTDKFVKHSYHTVYGEIFSPYKNSNIRMLEIGVYHGGSAIIWNNFFPNADITLVDIEPRTSISNIKGRVDENRTRIIISDAYEKSFSEQLGTFDIIIDDGPHSLESMKKCIELYFDKLNVNGLLVIEDIVSSDWIEELIQPIKNEKYSVFDLSSRAASDSRMLVIWK